MSTRAKQLCLVLAAQTMCVGVGLWMQHRFVAFSVARAFQRDVWSDMEAGSREFATELIEWGIVPSSVGEERSDQVGKFLDQNHPPQGDVVIVDSEWRVAYEWGHADPPTAGFLSPGQPVVWIEDSEDGKTLPEQSGAEEPPAPLRGLLEGPEGLHMAVAYPLPNLRGYILIHGPLEATGATTSEILKSLPAIAGLTLLWTCVLTGVAVYMILARFHDHADRERVRAAADTLKRKQNLIRTRDAVIFGLAKLADSRDPETGQHLERISFYATKLASSLRQHPKFSGEITPGFVRLIGISAALHDIGKVGVADAILLKRGKLTREERARMQLHTIIGGQCLQEIEQRLGSSNFLQMAREIAFAHHERWDGTGYPYGLAAHEIPLPARIVSIVDVYDALSSKRVYKEAIAHDECVDIIRKAAGTQFDPDLLEVWLTVEAKLPVIARHHADPVTGGGERPTGETPVPPEPAEEQMSGKETVEKLVSPIMSGE